MASKTVKENGNGAFAVGLRWCSRWLCGALVFPSFDCRLSGPTRAG
jgi:hypothetical protein